MEQPNLDPEVLEAALAGATYPVTWEVSNWTTQLSSDFKHALHRGAARVYARRYFAEHGRLPEGTHRVVLSVGQHGRKGDADLGHPFISTSLSDRDRRFDVEITFPAAPPAAP